MLPVTPLGAVALSCTLLASLVQNPAPVEQRRSPINVKVKQKVEQTEEESADENVMLEVGVSSSFVAVYVPRVAFLCLRPCF